MDTESETLAGASVTFENYCFPATGALAKESAIRHARDSIFRMTQTVGMGA